MSKNIEVWSDYDKNKQWRLNIRKKRGTLTLEEIRQACEDYKQDEYLLVICAKDKENGQDYETDDLTGDYVQLYRADDFYQWKRLLIQLWGFHVGREYDDHDK